MHVQTNLMNETKISAEVKHANSVIKNHMIWSMGAGFIPLPIVDFFAVSAIQLDMIRQLCKVFEVDFEETQGKALITALTGTSLARLGANAVKLIPGVGTMLGGVTLAALSGGSTYALGEVFKKHFETGGTFLDFDPSRLKDYYNAKFEKGKEMAKEMKPEDIPNPEETVVNQLAKLVELKNNGVLTEEEFQKMKDKIVNS